jgi:trehalose 6-phosphate phosphatase
MSNVLKHWALFLDFDGTLVDIAASPNEILVPRELSPILDRLTLGLSGALAIISGRPVREIDNYLRPLRPVAAGVHGAERRTIPRGEVRSTVEPLDDAILSRVKGVGSIDAGIVIEPKQYSVAVHYRNAQHVRLKIEAALRSILDGGPDHLILCPGRKAIEVVPRQVSKGMALASLMEEPLFRGRTPVMIGDDYSDESAFDMAKRLGGSYQRVAGEYFGQREAEFESPAHLRAWLNSLCEHVGA